jgi:hypothetical protein
MILDHGSKEDGRIGFRERRRKTEMETKKHGKAKALGLIDWSLSLDTNT